MKKLLAALLAMLMLCGGMAVGAGAFELPGKSSAMSAGAGGIWAMELPEEDWDEIRKIMNKVDLELLLTDAYLDYMFADLADHLLPYSALKAGKTYDDYYEAQNDAWDTFDKAGRTFDSGGFDRDGMETAYKAGTLENDYRKFLNDNLPIWNSVFLPLLNEYYREEALDALVPHVKTQSLSALLHHFYSLDTITEEKFYELAVKIESDEFVKLFSGYWKLLEEGKWAEAEAKAEAYYQAVYDLFVAEGLITPPPPPPCEDCNKFPCECSPPTPPKPSLPGTSFEATIVNWILYIVAFGWIWMRFFK